MKSLKVDYVDGSVSEIDGVKSEQWLDVCDKFAGDVHRLKDISKDIYTALYECFDDDNNSVYYLVEEDDSLQKIRRKNFNKNIGI